MKRTVFTLGTAAICVTGAVAVSVGAIERTGTIEAVYTNDGVNDLVTFTPGGELVQPEGYRRWVFVGSSVTPHDMNDGSAVFPEHHNTYLDPDSVDHYAETGEFRDGAILIKDLLSVGGKQSASGHGYFQGEHTAMGVMIKSAARFPDAPGNWGYFAFDRDPEADRTRARPSAKEVGSSCIGCHGFADTDSVFTGHYPVLRAMRDARPD
ncbi:MAG: cytochrome P460 family protein [Planctomycetota bacterium]